MNSPIGVLVTRPAHQAQPLIDLLETSGFQPIPLPALAINSITPKKNISLELTRTIIFISPNAVTEGLKHLPLDHLSKLNICAVGKKTAEALQKHKLKVTSPETKYDSESLLELSIFQQIKDQHILIVRGQGGREHLANSLKQRGAKVEYLEVYQRICPDISVEPILKNAKNWQVTTATSNQILDNLVQLFAEDTQTLLKRPIIIISQRMQDHAKTLGFQKIHLADQASNEAILKALQVQYS